MNHRIAVGLLAVVASTVNADVHLPALFGDHMLLQRDMPLHIWGTADRGEAVTVSIAGKTASATADVAGKWRIDLPSLAQQPTPIDVNISGNNKVTLHDVLVGDVWLCSGQSNMEFPLAAASNAATAIADAAQPMLRLFLVQRQVSLEPLAECQGKWVVCSPEEAKGFSAVGYFLGREISAAQHTPVGLIGSYWGGTPIQAWTSLEAMAAEPKLKHSYDWYVKTKANLPQLKAAHDQWYAQAGQAFEKASNEWKADRQKLNDWKSAPPRPVLSIPEPQSPDDPRTTTALFNGMIAPLIPYAIKGAIWYQGEANTYEGTLYHTELTAMIADWRGRWGEGNFPFLIVQLANFNQFPGQPANDGWAYLREAQLRTTQTVPNTGMAVTIDIGQSDSIHPRDKIDVGHRLAVVADRVAYQGKGQASGPLFISMRFNGNTVQITFGETAGGLMIAAHPATQPSTPPKEPPSDLLGFSIAGDDRHFTPAHAKIDGANDVTVWSDSVPHPVAVRYGWANDPITNLYNTTGLPASPFRTDNWPAQVSK